MMQKGPDEFTVAAAPPPPPARKGQKKKKGILARLGIVPPEKRKTSEGHRAYSKAYHAAKKEGLSKEEAQARGRSARTAAKA